MEELIEKPELSEMLESESAFDELVERDRSVESEEESSVSMARIASSSSSKIV